MKKFFDVKVKESYAQHVNVYVEDESLIEEEVSMMMENDEIEFDCGDCYDGWEIVSIEEVSYSTNDIDRIKKWCMNTVLAASIFNFDFIKITMDEYECIDWFEQLRDRGVDIPIEATSSDLWDAVEAYRKGDMSYGK